MRRVARDLLFDSRLLCWALGLAVASLFAGLAALLVGGFGCARGDWR